MGCDANPIWLAQSKLRRRHYDDCVDLCTAALQRNPLDQVAWYLKCRAITLKSWIDDTDIEEEGIADLLMDEHNVANVARPGTSLARPMTGSATGSGGSAAFRPLTGSGRPLTGFVRPGTGSVIRPGTGANKPGTSALTAAMKAARPGTSVNRPVTTSGRFVRCGTASMAAGADGPFIVPDRLDLRKYAGRPNLARVLCDFIIYVDHNMRKALELAAAAIAEAGFADWWWKERLGKAYYQLGLMRDAEKQLASAAKDQDMLVVTHQLAKVALRLDQPLAALGLFREAAQRQVLPDVGLLLGQARVQEALGNTAEALSLYQQVLSLDASNVEAIACLAADHFYSDQPEVALRYYRRLLQMGVVNAEILTNLGLCCFYAGQYDLCFSCFERALGLASDALLPDIWYNIGHVAIGIGDLSWASQCFRLAVALDPCHGEALNNLAVLEIRRGEKQQAACHLRAGVKAADHVFELHYNLALLAHSQGDLQEALTQVNEALAAFPHHWDSLELKKQLRTQLCAL